MISIVVYKSPIFLHQEVNSDFRLLYHYRLALSKRRCGHVRLSNMHCILFEQ